LSKEEKGTCAIEEEEEEVESAVLYFLNELQLVGGAFPLRANRRREEEKEGREKVLEAIAT
jgi:hypothetical protein